MKPGWAAVVNLYGFGLTAREIGADMGLHPSTVLYRLRTAGYEPRNRAEAGQLRVERDRLARFERLVDKTGECWLWLGHLSRGGYGQCSVNRRTTLAHRYFYERLVGPVPGGLTLDHLCRNRACVNPAHLEPVTMAENLRRGDSPSAVNRRKGSCRKGHPLAGDNLRMNGGRRVCRECSRRWSREYERRQAAAR